MSDQACFKEIICATAEAAYAISAYAEFATPDELDQCRRDTMRYQKMRNVLAERKDAADAEREIHIGGQVEDGQSGND